MRTLLTLQAKTHQVSFGVPTTNDEFQAMYALRYKVYHEELGYGQVGPNETDKDQFDRQGEALYLIATIEGVIVGCLRIVTTQVLPTERFYEFHKPFPKTQKGDWGRLISRPHWFGFEDLPRGVISTGLLLASLALSEEKGIIHGYGTMKKRAYKKIHSRGFPVKVLTPKRLIGMKGINGDPLQNFFSPTDPVVPLTFNLIDSKKFMVVLKENYFQNTETNIWKIPEKVSTKTKINIWLHSLWIRWGH